mmetsp:Transcript_8832/g.24827  ORF Transcript_8832/g.24827 Transcript_8832/m.24827 type:complete len:204 (-) Transcript_8832:484-1095(-)
MHVMAFLCFVFRVFTLLSWPILSLFWKMEKALRLLSCGPPFLSSSFCVSAHVPFWFSKMNGRQEWPAPIILLSFTQKMSHKGSSWVFTVWTMPGAPWVTSTTVRVESWEQKASWLPSGDQRTECTQPLASYSPSTSLLKGTRLPNGVYSGRLSIPLMNAEKTRTFPSVEAVATRMLPGWKSTEVTVESCFLMCLLTHQSLSSS